MPLFVIYGLLWVFLVALATDLLCLDFQRKKALQVISQLSLLLSACIFISSIYLIDKYDGDQVIWAFILSFSSLVIVETILRKTLKKKIGHLIGWIIMVLITGNLLLYTRYNLETKFFKPCWSPNGKQVAFFMQKNLIWYRLGIPFSGWSPNPLWSKNYLCTMNYDGGDFRQIKQTEQATDEISWSGSGEIVYTQHFMQDINTVLQRKILYTSPDGRETGTLYETAKIPTKTATKENGRILDPWLSKDKRFLGFVLNYQEPKKDSEEDIRLGRSYDNYRLMVKDLKTQQTKIDILQRDVKSLEYRKFYGSYDMSKIAYYDNDILEINDLGNSKIIKIDMIKFKQNGYLPFFSTWDVSGTCLLGMKDKFNIDKRELVEQNNNWYLNTDIIAPSGEMRASAGIVWDKNDKTLGVVQVKNKRSYLFNIFEK